MALIPIDDLFDQLKQELNQLRRLVTAQRTAIDGLTRLVHGLDNHVAPEHVQQLKHASERALAHVHRLAPPITCVHCHVVFEQQSQLTRHVRTHAQPLTCPQEQCAFVTRSKRSLEAHVNAHARHRPHTCNTCDKRFASQSSLRNHVRQVHRTHALRCTWPECGFSTRFTHRLKVHENVHRAVKPFACVWPGCDFSTAYQDKLKFHAHRHSGLKSFRCTWPDCQRSFRCHSHVAVHMRTHTRQRPFTCHVCARGFTTKQALQTHARRKHVSESLLNHE